MGSQETLQRRHPPLPQDIALISSLDDPVRASLFFYVSVAGREVGRDEAARALSLNRRVAAFHLDKLAEDGLLETTFRRLSGKSGPGAGRPNKLYRRSDRRIDVSLPPRNYELLARLLTSAIQARGRASADDRLRPGAEAFGSSIGVAVRANVGQRASRKAVVQALTDELAGHGFQPFLEKDGSIRLRNGP